MKKAMLCNGALVGISIGGTEPIVGCKMGSPMSVGTDVGLFEVGTGVSADTGDTDRVTIGVLAVTIGACVGAPLGFLVGEPFGILVGSNGVVFVGACVGGKLIAATSSKTSNCPFSLKSSSKVTSCPSGLFFRRLLSLESTFRDRRL